MHTVVIAGGGYSGLRAALKLGHDAADRFNVVLLDKRPVHQLITRLPEVAGISLDPSKSVIPFPRVLPRQVKFLQTFVRLVDPINRRIETDRGTIHGDWLLLNLGSRPHFANITGAESRAIGVKSIDDAMRLHRRVQQSLGERPVTRIVVIGGGYTASEVAGELAHWDSKLDQSRIPRRLEVTLVNDESTLLPAGNRRLGTIAERILLSKNVRILQRSPVVAVEDGAVVLTTGRRLAADVVVWGGASHGATPITDSPWPTGRDGRIVVDQYLRSNAPRVYISGDASQPYDYMRDVPVAATAQYAVQEGDTVAANILAEQSGRRLHEFKPKPLGEALSLGGNDGVAEVGGVVTTGRAAIAVKQAALLRYLRSVGGTRLAFDYAL